MRRLEGAAGPAAAPAVVTVPELARYLRIHPSSVLAMVKGGRIKGDKFSGSYRVHVKAVERFIDRRTF